MALNLGGIIRLTYAVKDGTGALVNPSTATLTIIQPDGTTAAGTTVSLPPAVTGQLVYDFTPTQAGLHSVHWATTVPTTAEDDVFVAQRPAALLISVDEAVARLRAANIITSDSDREQLQWLCLVASAAVEQDLNRILVRRTVTATYDGGPEAVQLYHLPVLSITSVTESGNALTGTDYTLARSGLLYRGGTTSTQSWASGRQNITVIYVAGYMDPPYEAREVALGTVQELWQASQQASHPLLEEDTGLAVQSAASLLPGPLRASYNRLRIIGVA